MKGLEIYSEVYADNVNEYGPIQEAFKDGAIWAEVHLELQIKELKELLPGSRKDENQICPNWHKRKGKALEK